MFFLNSALSFVFQFTSFSRNFLTCLFEIFPGNILNIKGFLIVLNKICINSFVYHVLLRSQSLLGSRIPCREIWYYVCCSRLWSDFLLPVFYIKFSFHSSACFHKTFKNNEGSKSIPHAFPPSQFPLLCFKIPSPTTSRNSLMSFSSNHCIVALK